MFKRFMSAVTGLRRVLDCLLDYTFTELATYIASLHVYRDWLLLVFR